MQCNISIYDITYYIDIMAIKQQNILDDAYHVYTDITRIYRMIGGLLRQIVNKSNSFCKFTPPNSFDVGITKLIAE